MTTAQTALRARLPRLQPLTALPFSVGDVLIHAPGFEPRTFGVLNAFSEGAKFRCVLLDYRPFDSRNQLPEVRRKLSGVGGIVEDQDILIYDRFSPTEFESQLEERLIALGGRRVTVDISTMSKLAILLVLNVCKHLDVVVRVIYTEAKTYGPSLDEFLAARAKNEIRRPTLQIFDGVHGVVRVPSLTSVAMQGQPTAALVFMSFNDALTQVLLNTVYPSRLFLINGRPPVHSWREEAMAWIHDHVRREWEGDNPVLVGTDAQPRPVRSASTLDYCESVMLLLDLYWELSSSYRVLLAPAGSKMQAFGCWVTKALHPDIHVEYPSPEGFHREYSSGIAGQWCLKVGRVRSLLAGLAAEERRSYLELGAE